MAIARSTVSQRSQLGLESTPGTLVAATKRLPTMMIVPKPDVTTKAYRMQGTKFDNQIVLGKEWSTASADGEGSYSEMIYPLSSVFGAPAAPQSVGTGGYLWTFEPSSILTDTPSTYTIQHGDQNNAVQFGSGIFTDWALTVTREECKMTSAMIGQAFQTGASFSVTNDVQTITITGSPTGGYFTLTFNGQTTGHIVYNAIGSAVTTALTSLSNIGPNNVAVTGSAGGPYTATFQNQLGDALQPLLTSDATNLTPTSTIAVVHATPGSPTIVEQVPIIPNQVSVFMDDTYANIGTTQLPNLTNFEVSLTGRWAPVFYVDATHLSFVDIVEALPKLSGKIELEANDTSDALLATLRTGATKYLQVVATGPQISSGVHYQMVLTLPFQIEKPEGFADQGGLYAFGWTLAPVTDPTAGYAIRVALTNKTAAL